MDGAADGVGRTDYRENGPGWLRGYERIEADLRGMQAYADALLAELDGNYTPHRQRVSADMVVPAPSPVEDFAELVAFLREHQRTQVMASGLLTAHGDATYAFSAAAHTISTAYGDADGLASARAADITRIIAAGPGIA